MKELRQAKGMKGFIIKDPIDGRIIFMRYEKGEPVEYEIWHSDLEVEIVDNEAAVKERPDKTDPEEYFVIDHSNRTLGKK